MAELSTQELQAFLQAYLNCVELCTAFSKNTADPHVRQALGTLVDELQEAIASLAGHLRRLGVAPGGYEIDRQGKARIRDVLGMRSLREQLLVVRGSLADLVAWYAARLQAPQADQAIPEWLVSLSAQADHMLEGWDQHMREMKAADF